MTAPVAGPLIETVPNISEGRSPEVIAQLVEAVARKPGVELLHRTSDPSHHRTVLTMVGQSAALERAILALAAACVRHIDLSHHEGVHPRIGALDVVPFVPLADTDMTACIDLSRSVGARIATELGVPVFLYERSAMSEDRRRLESIRRGGFEGLAARMALPEWHPDFGAATPHATAGATAVGARRLLIAWNLDLDCSRLDVAREIAAAVRERGGGLPSVKAMGVLVAHRGVVQVSMNLTDYTKTSMDVLYTRVVGEAQRRGTSVRASEIIGLVPREALVQAAARTPQLWEWHRDQILEDRIAGRVGR